MTVPAGVLARNNVTIAGAADGPTLVFVHGFGCDQNVWRFVAPAFAADHRVVLFDHVGAGGSDLSAYDRERYGALEGYAADVLEILDELDPGRPVKLAGHSVGATIGLLAAIARPERFESLVLIGPAARYVDGLEAELTSSFCRTDPDIAQHFARVAFLSEALPLVRTPTLVLQCAEDVIAPEPVGEYVHRRIAGSRLVHMRARGHCPHLSAPEETVAAMRAFL
jgi:sigma-B regulation protein RsbQ